tara:strand:+ start:1095 stop:1517 length:423 start_codon:yes stop_codon:yes gene_type:complete
MMALCASDLNEGLSHTVDLVHDLKRTQIVQYAGASGDFNPFHTDEIYATNVSGYPTVFAHGMLVMSITGKMLTDFVGDGRLTKYGARFTRQVWPGDDLSATATVTKISTNLGRILADFDVITTNQNGETVLKGYAQAELD